jgi:hypothetical protein
LKPPRGALRGGGIHHIRGIGGHLPPSKETRKLIFMGNHLDISDALVVLAVFAGHTGNVKDFLGISLDE